MIRQLSSKLTRGALALSFLWVLGMAVASADDADPPGRVARISLIKGSVSMQPAGDQDWSAAVLNRPMTTGDKLWTDQDSRAELDIGSAAIRLGSTTGVSFLNLDDRSIQLNVTAGTALVHVRDLGDQQNLEIDTPNIAVSVLSPGDYRVEVDDAGDTTVVKVSSGEAEAAASGQSVPIRTQQAFTFSGTDQVAAEPVSLGGPDALDEWSLERERRFQQAESSQYVAPEMTGAEDLDEYGAWHSDPDYGYVWTPNTVPVGWAPYHYGHWVWVTPWGWTWVDDAPWGFAPFHYGRWAYAGNRWCWVPGPRHIRPVYAPALVAWVGGGAAVVAGVAAVGWFALGPREVFVPNYRVSNNYVRNVNISNTTIINNTYITNVYENKVTNITYVNRTAPGAVIQVPKTVFTSAQPVAPRATRLPGGNQARLAVSSRAPDIAPERRSVVGNAAAASVHRPPQRLVDRPVVARLAPPPPPVPLDKQLEAIRANGGRPLARAQLTQMQPRTPNPQVRVVGARPARAPAQGAAGAAAGVAAGAAQRSPAGAVERSPAARPAERPPAGVTAQRPPAGAAQPPPSGASRPPAVAPLDRPATANRPAEIPPGGAARVQGMGDRERALRTTPIPPSGPRAAPAPSNVPPAETAPRANPPQNALRSDRPPTAQPTFPGGRPAAEGRPVTEASPTPESRSVPQTRPSPQAHPVESARPPAEFRSPAPPRPAPQAHPVPESRAPEPSRPAPEARPVTRPPVRTAPESRAAEEPVRPAPEAHAVEAPRPAPPPRPSPPPPRPEERRKPPDR